MIVYPAQLLSLIVAVEAHEGAGEEVQAVSGQEQKVSREEHGPDQC